MIIDAKTDKEKFYIENLIRLKCGIDCKYDISVSGIEESDPENAGYNVRLTLDGRTVCASASSSVSLHKSRTKALVSSIGKAVFECLSHFDLHQTPYGILTGVRPVKIALYYSECGYTDNDIRKILRDEYFIREDKIELLLSLAKTEKSHSLQISEKDFFLYVSIPFCPSRCSYCSFVSESSPAQTNLIPEYIDLLTEEIAEAGKVAKKRGRTLRGVYFGGGTPSILSREQLQKSVAAVTDAFDTSRLSEFTIECGRPDTITFDKLSSIKSLGVDRISINPQTTNDRILSIIGRKHTAKQFFDAFEMAGKVGFKTINTDLIAGLDGDSPDVFSKTLSDIFSLRPENITVHTLYRKRASFDTLSSKPLTVSDTDIDIMVRDAFESCINRSLMPYYLYRQKGTGANLENIGYSSEGHSCLYNIAMMEDIATVVSCGAGAISKIYRPYEFGKLVNTHEDYQPITRISSYKFPLEYIKNYDKVKENLEKIEKIL